MGQHVLPHPEIYQQLLGLVLIVLFATLQNV